MREVKVKVDDNVRVEGTTVYVGPHKKEFKGEGLKIWIEDGELKVEAKDKAMINTVKRIVQNMIKGVKEPYQLRLVARYAHFPIKLKYQNGKLIIENFLGEKKPREAKIPEDVKVTVKGQEIILESWDKEALGNAYTSIKQATRIRKKDRRVFQDGIYKVIE